MESPKSKERQPVSRSFRILAWFIVLEGTLAVGGALVVGLINECDLRTVGLLVPAGVLFHVALSVAIFGYAPRYLLFAHGPRDK